MSRMDDSTRMTQYRRIARLPWGTRFFEEIQLISPWTWRGAAVTGRVNWEWKTWIESAAAALFVPLAYHYYYIMMTGRERQVTFQRSSVLYSMWSLAWLWRGATGIRAVAQKMFLFSRWSEILGHKSMRSPANIEAWSVLSERITQRRAYRTRLYDVYLPPSLPPPARAMEAILFLPGFGVEHVAYSEPAARLADAGFVVVLLSAEPLRIASKELGFASSKIKRIQYDVCKRLDVPLSWSVLGHSLGSFTATHLALELDIPRIVMWGSAPMDQLIADLSTTNKRVMVVQGSNDKVIEFMVPDEQVRKKQTEQFYHKLPKETVVKSIQGGNHNAFGNYTPAFSIESSGISRNEQHAQAVALTVDFLRKV